MSIQRLKLTGAAILVFLASTSLQAAPVSLAVALGLKGGHMGKPAPDLELPADLVAFLAAGKRLEYDPAPCEAGAITLLPLSELKLERFPVETGSLGVYEQDPHYPDVNSYLVLGVNLVASCTGDYEPVGLLLWLPVERRFGIWDSGHCGIQLFGPEVTWERIAANPVPYINAGWMGIDPDAPPMEELVPWSAHPYHNQQVYKPQPA